MKRLTEPAPSVRAMRLVGVDRVDEAIRKALAPVAADRFSTVNQLAQALPVLTGASTVAASPRGRVDRAPLFYRAPVTAPCR